jgi:hypothetical protein
MSFSGRIRVHREGNLLERSYTVHAEVSSINKFHSGADPCIFSKCTASDLYTALPLMLICC